MSQASGSNVLAGKMPTLGVTVHAMLRLVRMNNRPSPEALVRAFSQRAYYCSAESII